MSDMIPEGNTQGQENETLSESPEISFHENGTSNENPQETQNESTVNPNWKEALDVLPDEYLRGKVTPIFKKWDDNNNTRFQAVQQELSKYDPYKPLIENNVPFEELQQAYQLRNEIANNPRVIFDRLASHLGIDVSTLLNGEQSQGLEEENPDGENLSDPRYDEVKAIQDKQNAFLAQIAAERQQVETQRWEQETFNQTKQELDTLQTKYGQFDRNAAVQFAIWDSEKTGQPLNLEQGVKSMLAYNDSILKNSANNSAPDVFSGGGGLPSGAADTSKMSDDEFNKYAAQRMEQRFGKATQ